MFHVTTNQKLVVIFTKDKDERKEHTTMGDHQYTNKHCSEKKKIKSSSSTKSTKIYISIYKKARIRWPFV